MLRLDCRTWDATDTNNFTSVHSYLSNNNAILNSFVNHYTIMLIAIVISMITVFQSNIDQYHYHHCCICWSYCYLPFFAIVLSDFAWLSASRTGWVNLPEKADRSRTDEKSSTDKTHMGFVNIRNASHSPPSSSTRPPSLFLPSLYRPPNSPTSMTLPGLHFLIYSTNPTQF